MSPSQAIRGIEARWPKARSRSEEEPVFLLSAGWRSGSTLLQRMLMKECFVWGEPFGRAMPIDGLMQPLTVFTDKWPPQGMCPDLESLRNVSLRDQWVANLYPPLESLLAAQVTWFTTLFQAPAAELGFRRWGFKEVRLGIEHAFYLRWLFPRARFLFLVRDPYASYRSFLALKTTYIRWPDQPVNSAEGFARHWLSLAEGFVRRGEDMGGMLIKYEELCGPEFDPSLINQYLGLDLDLSARDRKVGASPKEAVTTGDTEILQKLLGKFAAEELGYHP